MTQLGQLDDALGQFTTRYRSVLWLRFALLALLWAGIVLAIAYRINGMAIPISASGRLGILMAAGAAGLIFFGWALRRQWIPQNATAARLDHLLGLQQRLLTAAEFAKSAQATSLYPVLVDDALKRFSSQKMPLPKVLTRPALFLSLVLLLLVLLPFGQKSLLQQIASLSRPHQPEPAPEPHQPPPPQPNPASQTPDSQQNQQSDAQSSSGEGSQSQGGSQQDADSGASPSSQGSGNSPENQESAGQSAQANANSGTTSPDAPTHQDQSKSDASQSQQGSHQQDQPGNGTPEASPDSSKQGQQDSANQAGAQEESASAESPQQDKDDSRNGTQSGASQAESAQSAQGQQETGRKADEAQAGGSSGEDSASGEEKSSLSAQAQKAASGSTQAGQGAQGGELPGDQQALRAEIQELHREVSGELKQVQAQLETMKQQEPIEAGTQADPNLYGAAESTGDRLEGSLPLRLDTDDAATAKKRAGAGTGSAPKPGNEISDTAPQTVSESAELSNRPEAEQPTQRNTVPPEYQEVFKQLQQQPTP